VYRVGMIFSSPVKPGDVPFCNPDNYPHDRAAVQGLQEYGEGYEAWEVCTCGACLDALCDGG
jgi:hypothetical protein